MCPWLTFQGCLQCSFLLLHLPSSPFREQEMGVREPGCSSHPLREGLATPLISVSGASPGVGAGAGTPLADSPWACLCLQ